MAFSGTAILLITQGAFPVLVGPE